ncbi:FdhF/YdeP family oxidoreductase [Massilia sp. TN1-12]|uniref:FdhF/YdeP family oxidoreductase n=1 Tax=Massilia paldalensis TaxID=3377675 RepID=UPI00384C00B5
MNTRSKTNEPTLPAGGWGSVKEVSTILLKQHVPVEGGALLLKQNKPDGFMCTSCAWAKPAHPHPAEFCESGAKATAWEITSKRVDPGFFARHTLRALESWHDHELEDAGRLTVPMRWDSALDRYVEIGWEQAFAEIGAKLKALDPKKVVFYSSGRASLETSYMYGLLARMYGNNNLPDSSNMCHESTSVGLQASLGVPVGTVQLDDFDKTDCILFFGQNVGVNSPRMLHQLQDVRKRGVPIVTFNPLRERGLVSFVNPQSPAEMLTGHETAISTQYHQLKAGGDGAAIMGICKAVIATDDAALASGGTRVLDAAFLAEHTHGFDTFAAKARATSWDEIEQESGLPRVQIEEAAREYMRAKACMIVYGMGITQHRNGVENVQMLVNLLLLRGNIGKPGAGICPVRGHSNVQGQRTVGISEKPELVPLDKLKEQYGFEPPRDKGMNTIEACEAIRDGTVEALVSLGGNLVRAVPDHGQMEQPWRDIPLTVHIATKLNRSHLVHGRDAYLLPCLGRIEIDRQRGGEQAVSMEDSTACMHGSRGRAEPAADTLLSEPAIVAGIAKALLAPNPRLDWDAWVADYGRIRDAIAETYPEIFHDFNARMWTPGGFRKPLAAAKRVWNTDTKKANFTTPAGLKADPDMPSHPDALRLFTVRSDGQFNTTIYSLEDRFRGTERRDVLFMAREDMDARGLADGDIVTASTAVDDGVARRVEALRVIEFPVPAGCVAGYYPELNPLIPLWHYAKESKVPAAKSVDIVIVKRGTPTDPARMH